MSYLQTALATLEALRARTDEDPPAPDGVAGMTLTEFATAGLLVEVSSAVLGGRVLFVSDNVPSSRLAGARWPIYRAHELRRLAVLKPEPRTLRSLHEVKTIFEGTIDDVRPNEET